MRSRGVGTGLFIGVVAVVLVLLAANVVQQVLAREEVAPAPQECKFKSWFDPDYGCEWIVAPGCGVARRENAAGQKLVCRGPGQPVVD